MNKAEKRKAEVDTLFVRMYEDWRRGVSRNTTSLCCLGSTKVNRLNWTKRLNGFNPHIATESQNAVDAEKWIALMKECVNPTELTAELLNTLIEKIVVHEAVKGEDGSREQEVEIFYRFIGKIELNDTYIFNYVIPGVAIQAIDSLKAIAEFFESNNR